MSSLNKFILILPVLSFIAAVCICYPFMDHEPEPEFQRIAQEVAAAYEYDINNFNCMDFSAELVQKLTEAGYTARIEYSEDSKSGRCLFNPEWFKEEFGIDLFCHAWVVVEIPIEATTGKLENNKIFD